jgi:glycosyltransferase involved in cell wall biosynthesis
MKINREYFNNHYYRNWLKEFRPSLTVISLGSNVEGISWMDACIQLGLPYAIIVQVAAEHLWPDDEVASRFAKAYLHAKTIFFVSQKNKTLTERQFGTELPHALVVRNPFNVDFHFYPPYPASNGKMQLAVVGRIDPFHKGHDIVIDVLSHQKWKDRPLVVNCFGEGPKLNTLRLFAKNAGVECLHFKGHVSDIGKIWEEHHALFLPSRLEGTPLALVEALLSGRTAIVTDVGGNAEIVKDNITGFIARSASVHDVDEALERAWARRTEWEEIGKKAADLTREIIPEDPVAEFSEHLIKLL